MRYLALLAGFLLLIPITSAATRGTFQLPQLPEPDQYGNLIIDRNSTRNGVKPVGFSHWLHRQHFTCTVCHEEIGFELQLNGSEIKESRNRSGRFCGACHDGKVAFNVADEALCAKCHNGGRGVDEKFKRFAKEYFPATKFGNRVDWVQALKEGLIIPASSLRVDQKPVPFNKKLTLQAEWNFVPPAVFPHDVHLEWMNCSLCHPDTFNTKANSTEHFRMQEILKGNFCGVCHLNVAFPMDDCSRCHPEME